VGSSRRELKLPGNPFLRLVATAEVPLAVKTVHPVGARITFETWKKPSIPIQPEQRANRQHVPRFGPARKGRKGVHMRSRVTTLVGPIVFAITTIAMLRIASTTAPFPPAAATTRAGAVIAPAGGSICVLRTIPAGCARVSAADGCMSRSGMGLLAAYTGRSERGVRVNRAGW
jgi:hypothetical protein